MSSRGDLLRIRAQFEATQAKQEKRLNRFLALMGDGEGNLAVPGTPLFVYVRVLGRGVVECLNQIAPLRNDLPIIVGYDFKKPDTLQVLSIYEGGMSSFGPYAYLPPHHQAHEFQNADGGDDVVWVQKQAVIPLLCHPTSPTSMRVVVLEDNYPWLSGWNLFPGATSADLTARVPGVGDARFVLIYVNGATNALGYSNGATFPIGWPPGTAFSLVPAPPAGSVPVAAVYLPNGITAIDWLNLYDLRLFNQPMGGSVTPAAHALLDTTVHNDTATDVPSQGSLVAGNATPAWDELVIGGAQQILKVNAGGTDPEWGEPPITSISGYIRGSIFRGGAADWEVYDAKTDKQILVGDGVDIASVPVTQDVALANTGAATVVGIQARAVAAGAPADGQVYAWNAGAAEWQVAIQSGGGGGNPVFNADGVLVVATEVDGGYVCASDAEIVAVYLYCQTPGTAGNTIVDVHRNGVTIFTVQANRPTLAWNDPDGVAKSGVPDVVALVENDVLTVDIDQIATAAADMTVVIALVASPPVGTETIGARVYNSGNLAIPHAVATTLTFDSERFDTDDIHSVIANTSRLTCTQTGVYIVSGSIQFATNANGGRGLFIRLNGITNIATTLLGTAVAVSSRVTVSTIYELTVGDYVELQAYQTSGGALNVLASSNFSPEFAAVKAAKHSTEDSDVIRIQVFS